MVQRGALIIDVNAHAREGIVRNTYIKDVSMYIDITLKQSLIIDVKAQHMPERE